MFTSFGACLKRDEKDKTKNLPISIHLSACTAHNTVTFFKVDWLFLRGCGQCHRGGYSDAENSGILISWLPCLASPASCHRQAGWRKFLENWSSAERVLTHSCSSQLCAARRGAALSLRPKPHAVQHLFDSCLQLSVRGSILFGLLRYGLFESVQLGPAVLPLLSAPPQLFDAAPPVGRGKQAPVPPLEGRGLGVGVESSNCIFPTRDTPLSTKVEGGTCKHLVSCLHVTNWVSFDIKQDPPSLHHGSKCNVSDCTLDGAKHVTSNVGVGLDVLFINKHN